MSTPNPAWMPDWNALMDGASRIEAPPGDGYCYFIADAHLGDSRAPPGDFAGLLDGLTDARMVVFMGDLFKVWLAIPKYWDEHVRTVLEAFQRLQQRGVGIIFVVGNREYFLPKTEAALQRSELPFDHVVHGAAVLHWAGRRYGLTHGDLVNRHDSQYLRWRRISRSAPFEVLFRALPRGAARWIASRLERVLADTNQEIKIQYPLEELKAFTRTAMSGLDGFFLGHFHRDERLGLPGSPAILRIVPDWFSRKSLLRMDDAGHITPVTH